MSACPNPSSSHTQTISLAFLQGAGYQTGAGCCGGWPGWTSPSLYTSTLPLICFICFGVQRNGWGRTHPGSLPHSLVPILLRCHQAFVTLQGTLSTHPSSCFSRFPFTSKKMSHSAIPSTTQLCLEPSYLSSGAKSAPEERGASRPSISTLPDL